MVGIDIEEIERFKNLDQHLMERIYTKNEIEYCQRHVKPHVHFAGMWCCKEAVVKALKDLSLAVSEVEILHDNNGAPDVNVSENLKQYFTDKKITGINVSISHTNKIATAIAMIER